MLLEQFGDGGFVSTLAGGDNCGFAFLLHVSCRASFAPNSDRIQSHPQPARHNAARRGRLRSVMGDENQLKLAAAESAAEQVTGGMIVGLGSGSTAALAVNVLG